MDIRFNALNSYSVTGKMNVSGSKKPGSSKNDKSSVSSKKDSISLSSNGVKNSGLYKLNATMRSEIDALSSQERISAIKASIRNGSYNVSSEEVADAILDRFV